MSEASATALSFSLLALVLLWFIVFELLPDLWADSRRFRISRPPEVPPPPV